MREKQESQASKPEKEGKEPRPMYVRRGER